MKISCTVKEFGQLVRGCEKRSCYNCPLEDVCNANPDANGIESFISAADIVDEPETGGVSDG